MPVLLKTGLAGLYSMLQLLTQQAHLYHDLNFHSRLEKRIKIKQLNGVDDWPSQRITLFTLELFLI